MSDLVILTRPKHRNTLLAARLKRDGANVLCLPALRLEPMVTCAQQMLWPENFDVLIFVSGHAARLYLDCLQTFRPGATWPAHVHAATVGGASADPLYQSGFVPAGLIFHPQQGIDGQDSEGLWRVLKPVMPKIKRALIVRGQAGREWLGARLEEQGAQVTRFSLYRREPEIWDSSQADVLMHTLRAGQSPLFLLTSSESVDAVYTNMQRMALMTEWAQCRFIVIHERISIHLQTILQAAGLHLRHPITICAPSDDAIYQAIRLSVSSTESL